MADDKTTGKIAPRKGEPTDKVKTFDYAGLMKSLRANPLVLAALVGSGSLGGQEFFTAIGQNVQWWWIALGGAGLAAFDVVGRVLKRLDRVVDDVGDIKISLAAGAERFNHIETKVESLARWKAEELAGRIAAAQAKSGRARSDGKLPTRRT